MVAISRGDGVSGDYDSAGCRIWWQYVLVMIMVVNRAHGEKFTEVSLSL